MVIDIRLKYYVLHYFFFRYKAKDMYTIFNVSEPVAYLGFHFGGGGGVQNFSGKVGVFAWREAPCSSWRSHAFARGVRGHAPPRKFLKMVQFGAF